jgi:hypothetical protein
MNGAFPLHRVGSFEKQNVHFNKHFVFIFFHVIHRRHPPNIGRRYLYTMDTQNINKYSYILWIFIGYHKGWEGEIILCWCFISLEEFMFYATTS